MAMASRRAPRRGFTLIELVIVVAVIAILAALLVPVILNQIGRARVATERDSIVELTNAFRRFRTDTARWPLENGVWPMATNVDADEFTTSDTALFANLTPPMAACVAMNIGLNCWGGPYLSQTVSTGALTPTLIDSWGRPRMFTLIRPFDGAGGGTAAAPNGFVAVWSRGPDGLDSYGCFNAPPGCVRDLDRMAQGLPSQAAGDDIIVLAGSAN